MVLKRLERAPGARTEAKAAPKTGLARILYVEDEDANWYVTELHLRDRYHLTRAQNSTEALTLLAREHFDLILLDIQLSGSPLDGIQICRAIREGSRCSSKDQRERIQHTPIVFVTAYSARYDKQALMDAGGDDVVTKPVDYTRLLLVSSRLLVRTLQTRA